MNLNLNLKVLITFATTLVVFAFVNLDGAGLNSPVFSLKGEQFNSCSNCCSMPCCQKEVTESECCCSEKPLPANNNLPFSNTGEREVNPSPTLIGSLPPSPRTAYTERKNMVGWTSGFKKAVPPPVKLFIFNEAILC